MTRQSTLEIKNGLLLVHKNTRSLMESHPQDPLFGKRYLEVISRQYIVIPPYTLSPLILPFVSHIDGHQDHVASRNVQLWSHRTQRVLDVLLNRLTVLFGKLITKLPIGDRIPQIYTTKLNLVRFYEGLMEPPSSLCIQEILPA